MMFVWNLQISVFEAIKLYGESVYVSHVIYYRARSIKTARDSDLRKLMLRRKSI